MPKTISLSDLPLEGGGLLRSPVVAYSAWGELNEAGDNTVLVCHSLTNDTDVEAWWPGLIGPGRVLDTDRFFVVCLNTIGSPYGSTSPLSLNPETGARYGGHFPVVTVRDTVQAHYHALRRLGVRRVQLAVGGSMGGMQVLEWGYYRGFVRALVPIAVGARHSPWGIAWTAAQRTAIYSDPNWNDGQYSDEAPPAAGLATARMMAMISYRSATEFEDRFGREASGDDVPGFSVESYLRHHGRKLVDRFDANCYVLLTRQMNSHDVSRGRGPLDKALSALKQPALVVGIDSDILYPLHEQRELAELLPRGELCVLEAGYGHDSFLVESERFSEMITAFLDRLEVDADPVPHSRPASTRHVREYTW